MSIFDAPHRNAMPEFQRSQTVLPAVAINNGNFFIMPDSGDVLICDNDNVSPFGTNLGIMGKQHWMAPEIVTGQNDSNKNSDCFSLAVVLFRLLFIYFSPSRVQSYTAAGAHCHRVFSHCHPRALGSNISAAE